jgi:geranyl-CoA carboxylase alpha subunit
MRPRPFTKVLVANRGEIARRVLRAVHAEGLRSVAVYSDADRNALHVAEAHEAVRLGPAPAAQSYLNVERLLDAAHASGADAVHPGYGFLAESAAFAQACAAAGLVYVGPSAAVIAQMGNKRRAKEAARHAGVRCIAGSTEADATDAQLEAQALGLGFPVMIKAAAGGGGRGLRRVQSAEGLRPALALARAEAKGAFGDAELIVERALPAARHVEIQLLADTYGNVLHLGERECSVQRRHQKLIEEAPSPAVDPGLRARMGAAAIALARACGYVGAGTVEFLLDAAGAFYFLEMNTRIQVEHAVTEALTGMDLVVWQLRIAAGAVLSMRQDEIPWNGHAMEARLYAEDPARGFLPQQGRVLCWAPAPDPALRIEHSLRPGTQVSLQYDALLAKFVASGPDRDTARRRLLAALADSTLLGVVSNKAFLQRLLADPDFVAGRATTAMLDGWQETGAAPALTELTFAAIIFYLICIESVCYNKDLTNWTNAVEAPAHRFRLGCDEQTFALALRAFGAPPATFELVMAEHALRAEQVECSGMQIAALIDGRRLTVRYAFDGPVLHMECAGEARSFVDLSEAPLAAPEAAGDGQIRAPLAGMVVAVKVQPGEQVTRGTVLVVVESMKMLHAVPADTDGVVAQLYVASGETVQARQRLAVIEPRPESVA